MDTCYLDRGDGVRIAYAHRTGAGPTIVFLPGYASDMSGGKATALDEWAASAGRAMLRFDYSGCGASEGRFEDGTPARWRDDALAVIDAVTAGRLVLVGSSMGGWLMLLIALSRAARVTALVGIAAAPDFTDWGFTPAQKAAFVREGRVLEHNPYGPEPTLTTRGFWEGGQAQLLLGCEIGFDGPVRLLHGGRDAEVPLHVSLELAAALRSGDVQTILVKGGDHRLSRPADLALLVATVAGLPETP